MDTTTYPEIIIYSTPTCHFCHMTKDFLGEHDIAFTDYNVAEDAEKRNEMVELTGQMGVPVIKITTAEGADPEIIIGFDEKRLRELLTIE